MLDLRGAELEADEREMLLREICIRWWVGSSCSPGTIKTRKR